MGGLDRYGVIANGPVSAIRSEVEHLLGMASRKTVLGASCTVANTTPLENLKTAIDVAHNFNG